MLTLYFISARVYAARQHSAKAMQADLSCDRAGCTEHQKVPAGGVGGAVQCGGGAGRLGRPRRGMPSAFCVTDVLVRV